MKRIEQKPLDTIRHGRLKATIYKARFRPFESTKYLNIVALKRAKKVPIQIGWIEAVGMNITLEAEVRKGLITKIRPVGCKNCGPQKKSKRKHRSAFNVVAREVLKRARVLGKRATLPIPVSAVSKLVVGRIIIITNDDWDICITVYGPFGVVCIFCLFAPGVCFGPAKL